MGGLGWGRAGAGHGAAGPTGAGLGAASAFRLQCGGRPEACAVLVRFSLSTQETGSSSGLFANLSPFPATGMLSWAFMILCGGIDLGRFGRAVTLQES